MITNKGKRKVSITIRIKEKSYSFSSDDELKAGKTINKLIPNADSSEFERSMTEAGINFTCVKDNN